MKHYPIQDVSRVKKIKCSDQLFPKISSLRLDGIVCQMKADYCILFMINFLKGHRTYVLYSAAFSDSNVSFAVSQRVLKRLFRNAIRLLKLRA